MSGDLHFKEVIRPPIWLMAFVAFMLLSVVIAVWAAFDNQAALYTSCATFALLLLFFRSSIHRIEIRDGELFVNRAHIELKYLGECKVLNKNDFLNARSRELDPAAYPALIYWVSRGVKLEIKDHRDATPYWLISMRRGEELRALLANSL